MRPFSTSDFEELARGSQFLLVASQFATKSLESAAHAFSPEGGWAAPNATQVSQLKSQGCRADDWSALRISAHSVLDSVFNCRFEDQSFLDLALHAGQPTVLENSRLKCVFVRSGATILDCSHIEHVIVEHRANVIRCGKITGADPANPFGLKREIIFAPGTGGRQLPVFMEATSDILAQLARCAPHSDALKCYRDFCVDYRAKVAGAFTFIGAGALVSNVGTMANSFIGEFVHIDGAQRIAATVIAAAGRVEQVNQLLNTSAAERCEFANGASTDNTHFCEASWAKDNARVTSSIIAPNSGTHNGEVRSSFLGPFVGFNHQALCIAAYWPGGKGNVSYGANVGSNHTGKAADQENWAGEGVFFGLGSNIKFPCNTLDAPYSIFSTGLLVPPQRISLPFSLIAQPTIRHESLPGDLNEIVPGWQILHNLFGLLRNEQKYRERNKARRERIELRVFRPELLPLVVVSQGLLDRLGSSMPSFKMPDGEPVYLGKSIPEAGANYIRESGRKKGVAAYSLARSIINAFDELDSSEEHPITAARFLEISELMKQIIDIARNNKLRDRHRGLQIIPDYDEIHDDSADESLYRWLQSRLQKGRVS